jgi:hypothetical protein
VYIINDDSDYTNVIFSNPGIFVKQKFNILK